jgi:hypothetical protein
MDGKLTVSDSSSRGQSPLVDEKNVSERKNEFRKQTRFTWSSFTSGSSRKCKSDGHSSSLVVDYYYHLYHPENEEENEDDTIARGRCCSFGTIAKEVKGRKRCFVISPIGLEGSEVRYVHT